MKKLLALLLSLVMVLALVPFTAADGADYTLVIKGGEVNDNLEGGLLAVDLLLNGTTEDMLVAVTVDLTFDPEQITFVKGEAGDDFNSFVVNDTVAGQLRIAATSEGMTAGEEVPVGTLYFKVADGLEAGTEIAFEVGEEAYAETQIDDPDRPNHVIVTQHDLAADFSPYVVSEAKAFNGVVKFNDGAVQYKGKTPYVMYDAAAGKHEPAFTVYEEDETTVIDPANYDFEYKENTLPGTGYLFVTFKNEYAGEEMLFFKIYLPATTWTKVENVQDGILIQWTPVEGAAGYVIYRRAASAKTNNQWTSFERWWNVTGTEWIDGPDDAHKVYAGTRYQYGVKAYFARRLDPIAGEEIGGNVNEPSGNYNLGIVGPLKTTVRITTRVLNAVEAGAKQMTVTWSPSGLFDGTEIEYATDANFTQNKVSVKVECRDANNKVIKEYVAKGLTSGKTYYVHVRSYHVFEGVTYYGEWSNVLDCKVK